jgi:HK97 family phage major capsid protein/HK97 family phage prohead protease
MDRAYSLLEIKAVDEDARVIEGIATTPEPDRVGDIVEPLGAQFKNPLPLLWQHRHDSPVGNATFGKPTKAGIPFRATIAKIDEPGALKDLLDLAWQSVKAKLVRGVSIGFRALEHSYMDTGGIRFTSTEILELSLVTVPANASATIQSIKSLDHEQRAASGQSLHRVVRVTPPGASGSKSNPNPKPQEGNMNIADQIKALEATRAEKLAKMNALTEKSAGEGRTKDAAEREEFDTLRDEIKAIDAELVDLRDLEKINVEKAKPVDQKPTSAAGAGARDLAVVKNTEKLEPGIEFTRYAMCLVAAKGDHTKAAKIAANKYPQNERIVKALQVQAETGQSFEQVLKANVNAGATLDSTWAAPLVDYQNFAGDFVEYLRPQTILGQFGVGGIPALNSIPFNVRITGQTSGGTGYWVGEGAPKPLTKFDFNATELRWAKVAAISVLTEELIRFSNPSAERLVRQALADALRARLDIDFIDPSKAASSNVSPASITNGVTAISSTGSDADAIRTDIRALWAPFIAANNPPNTAVYIMSSTTALALSLMVNTLGQPEFPGLTMRGGTLGGVPVIVSEYADNTAGSAGGLVILVNARDIWLADDGGFTIDASREASLQMDDAPTNDSSTGTEASLVSMWQTNSVALRAERYINWAKRRTSAVAYLDAVTWGQ